MLTGLLLFAPHVLPVGGTVQLHVPRSDRTALIIGAGAAYDLPFTSQHDVWKFQVEGGVDRYLGGRAFAGGFVGARFVGSVWSGLPFIGGDHIGAKLLWGHRWTGEKQTVSPNLARAGHFSHL